MAERLALHKRGLHKDWRTWAVLIAMLAAIGSYVMSLDDSDEAIPATPVTGAP
jgi:hypothetical protein